MQEIIIAKAAKLLLSWVCYGGTSMVIVNQTLDNTLVELLKVHPKLQNVVVILLIIFWLIKICWYVFDKRLEWLERKQKMRHEEDEHK